MFSNDGTLQLCSCSTGLGVFYPKAECFRIYNSKFKWTSSHPLHLRFFATWDYG